MNGVPVPKKQKILPSIIWCISKRLLKSINMTFN